MLFNILVAVIFLAAVIFFAMDFARAKPEVDRKANFLFDFGEILTMVCITLISGALVIMLTDKGYMSNDHRAIIIAMAFFLMPFRKVLAIVVQGLVSYLCAVDNAFAQRVEPFLIVKDPDPLAQKPMRLSLGVLRIGHTVIFVLCALVTAICATIPGITNSRINVTLNVFNNLVAKVVGSGWDRLAFLVWFASLIAFWVIVVVYIRGLYTNTIALSSGGVGRNVKPLRWAAIILWWARKVFIYLFIMTNYRLQDFVFWWFIWLIAIVVLALWRLHQRRTTP